VEGVPPSVLFDVGSQYHILDGSGYAPFK
jgi:hypothetical protein